MSFNGSGTFVVNSSGQPVVTGTVISSTAFNALTADLATGLSTCVTKDGQTATTVRVPFAFGINSTLTTDATSTTTGSIITAGGISTQKALFVGTTSNFAGATTLSAALTYGGVTLSNAVTGTGNMVLSASPTLTGTLTAATITASGAVTGTAFIPSSATVPANGLYLPAANTIGLAANSTEVMRSTSTQMTLAVPIAITRTVAGALNSVVSTNADTGTGSYATFQARNLTYVLEMAMFGTGWTTSAQYRQNGAIMEANGPGGIVLSASHASGDLFLYNRNTLALTLGASQAATFASSVTATLFTPTATGNNGLGLAAAGTPAIYVNGTTEAARFDTSGRFQFGTTTSVGAASFGVTMFPNGSVQVSQNTTGAAAVLAFYNPNGTVGTIQTSGSSTSYNTSSDYRLKKNVLPMTNGLATVAALKPVTYNWIADQTAGEGFIAHELQAVIPAAVSGEKDAVDDKGEINPQGVDFGKIVPHLVAAIQELTTRLAALENK